MPLRGIVGEVCSRQGSIHFDWTVQDLLSLSEEVDDFYNSPSFDFAGRSWFLQFNPNGQKERTSEGWVSLYLVAGDSGPPLLVQYTLGVRSADGKVDSVKNYTYSFDKKNRGFGTTKAVKRSELSRRNSELFRSGGLTFFAALQAEGSMVMGTRDDECVNMKNKNDVCLNLKNLLSTGKNSDVVLKVGNREFRAHRLILETRSPVFGAMFDHETEENQTGVVKIPDIEPDVFELVLSYMYSGDIDGISSSSVCQVFMAADKYDLEGLKQWCGSFMEENLSVDNVCSVLSVADKCCHSELKMRAEKYFVAKSIDIVDNDDWEEFITQNPELAIKLLTSTVKNYNSNPK